MAWTAPMTAIANTSFTAAQFNLYVRDNLNETAPAKATTAGRIFVATGTNAIAERLIDGDTVSTSQTTASTSYADLATAGPSVTATTGVRALVWITADIANSTGGATSFVGVDVSGATTSAAVDSRAIQLESSAANDHARIGVAIMYEVLNSGSNVFKMQYKVSAGTGTFLDRHIAVMAL